MQVWQQPFLTRQIQQERRRWRPIQPQQQQLLPWGMQGKPGGGQMPFSRGIRQMPPRSVPGRQPQAAWTGGASKRLGGMGQPPQVLGGMEAQRSAFKSEQDLRNQLQGHPGSVAMQRQESVQQTLNMCKNFTTNCHEMLPTMWDMNTMILFVQEVSFPFKRNNPIS